MLALLIGCGAQPSPEHPAASVEPVAVTSPGPPPTPAPAASAAANGEPCGPLECRRFASAAAAFRYLLRFEPLVLGLGEAHALSASAHIPSTARRFTEELLPALDGRASHLVVELLSPNPRCQGTTQSVREAHEPVTREQSSTNQNDYVTLGLRARALGIEPFVLSPTCEEYQAIESAGEDAISQTLTTIASVTSRMLRAALVKNRSAGQQRLVLAYGGALHNDLAPEPSRASWSYGPELSAFTGGRYLELDLIVREFIKSSDAWRRLPWYEHFEPELYPQSSVLMRSGPQSYVLFFPQSPPAEPASLDEP